MVELFGICQARGFQKIFLMADADNERARRLYQSTGMRMHEQNVLYVRELL